MALLLVFVVALCCSNANQNKIENGNEIEQAKSDSFLTATVNGISFYSDAPIGNPFFPSRARERSFELKEEVAIFTKE